MSIIVALPKCSLEVGNIGGHIILKMKDDFQDFIGVGHEIILLAHFVEKRRKVEGFEIKLQAHLFDSDEQFTIFF